MKRNGISQQQLYQVVVQCNGLPLPVGPRVLQSIAQEFAATIRKLIIDGKEREWSDPQVVPVNASGIVTLH